MTRETAERSLVSNVTYIQKYPKVFKILCYANFPDNV